MSANVITMLDTIVPKSDQLNADDLIGGPLTITLTKVSLTGDEQPVALHFEGDNGKPYKPGKSMRRVLVHLWGPDANVYAGRSLTLYRDEKVMFGGVAVGGIRISHMTHIERDITIALTATRANRKPFTVKPLKAQGRSKQDPRPPSDDRHTASPAADDSFPGDRPATEPGNQVGLDVIEWAGALLRSLDSFDDVDDLRGAWVSRKGELAARDPDLFRQLNKAVAERAQAIAGA